MSLLALVVSPFAIHFFKISRRLVLQLEGHKEQMRDDMRRVSWRSHGATTSALRHCGFLYLLFYPNPFAFSFSTLKYRFILYGGFGRSPLPVLRRFASIKTTKPSEGGAAWRSRGSINSTLQSAREISLSIFVGQRHPTTVNEQMRTFCFVTFPVPSTLTWS
mgnify:FL=1